MCNRLLSLLALTILVALVGCGQGSTPGLTILSIAQGEVLVMKSGTDTWTEEEDWMTLEVGDEMKT